MWACYIGEISESYRKQWKPHTRSFDLNLKLRTCSCGIQPFIGAAMLSGGARFYSAQKFFRLAELGFRAVPRYKSSPDGSD